MSNSTEFTSILVKIIAIISIFTPNQLLATTDIEIWTRGVGQHQDRGEPIKSQVKKFNLLEIKLEAKQIFDAQYQSKHHYQGIKLEHLIKQYDPGPEQDMALLHFANHMIIPVFLETGGRIKGESPFVALKMKNENQWVVQFPEILREDPMFRDPRPIKFSGNKIVVTSLAHAHVPKTTRDAGFSPWRYADSLTAIEFASVHAYYRQFSFADKDARVTKGQLVFQQRCQFCHSVRDVGAKFGWDYVTPLPIFKKKEKQHLFQHVKYEKIEAFQRGLAMPRQKDISEKEVDALWEWMRAAAAAKNLNPYELN